MLGTGKVRVCCVRLWQTPWNAPYLLCMAEIICGISNIDFAVDWNHPHINKLAVFLGALRGHYFFHMGTFWRIMELVRDWVGTEPSAFWLQSSVVPLGLNLLELLSSWEDHSRLFSRANLGQTVAFFSVLLPACLHCSSSSFTLPSLFPVQGCEGSFPGPGILVLPRCCQEGEQCSQIACLGTISFLAIEFIKGQWPAHCQSFWGCLDFLNRRQNNNRV